MNRSLLSPLTLVVAAGVALGAAGCGAAADKASEEVTERIIESQTDGDVELDVDGDGGYSIETEDGRLDMGSDIPDDWPDDIALPDDLTAVGGMSTSDGTQAMVSVTGSTSSSMNAVLSYFADELSGWEIVQEFEMNGDVPMSNVAYENGDRALVVAVSDDGESRTVALTYTEGAS